MLPVPGPLPVLPGPTHTPTPPGLRLPAQNGVRGAGGGVCPGAAPGAEHPGARGFPRATRQGRRRGGLAVFGEGMEAGHPLSTLAPAEGIFPGRSLPADPRVVGAGPGCRCLAGRAGRAAAPRQPAPRRHGARWVQGLGEDPRPSGVAGGALVNGVEPSCPVVTPLSQ